MVTLMVAMSFSAGFTTFSAINTDLVLLTRKVWLKYCKVSVFVPSLLPSRSMSPGLRVSTLMVAVAVALSLPAKSKWVNVKVRSPWVVPFVLKANDFSIACTSSTANPFKVDFVKVKVLLEAVYSQVTLLTPARMVFTVAWSSALRMPARSTMTGLELSISIKN